MDLATFNALLAPAGQELLARLAAVPDLREETALRHLTRLRRDAPAELAAAALDTALLRQRGVPKFARAERMYFTREALEQASAEIVARYRARRFHGYERVVDLGCGIGGDTLALATEANAVTAVDHDAVRLAMARANAEAYGIAGRVTFEQGDVRERGPGGAPAAWLDPARRTATGKRVYTVKAYEPPLSIVRGWLAETPALGVKISPGVALSQIAVLEPEAEIEFISVAGDLREAVLWFGPLRTAARRATLLPGNHILTGEGDNAPVAPAPPGRFLLEPDPAVYRAGLLTPLATGLQAWTVDETIAYLSTDTAPASQFVRAWLVEETLPFSIKGVRRWLRDRRVGRVVVKKRGSPLDPAEFERMLKLDPSLPERRTLFLTRTLGRPVVIVCGDELAVAL